MATQVIAEPILPRQEHLEVLVLRRIGNRVRGLRIVMQADGLVLQGRATSFHAKQVAQQAVMALAPLPILANDIEVC